MNNFPIQKITWNEIEHRVKSVNKELWSTLKAVSEKSSKRKLDFYLLRYRYGDSIIENGVFKRPGSPTDISREELEKDLSYSEIPLCLVLTNRVQISVDLDSRTIPLTMIETGNLFGVFETNDVLVGDVQEKAAGSIVARWNGYAGATSAIVLAPRNEALKNNLQAIVRRPLILDNGSIGWKVIRQLDDAMGDPWTVEVLVFPRWVVDKMADLTALREDILKAGWIQLQPLRNYVIQEAFVRSRYLAKVKNLKGELANYPTIRHLLAISNGDMPAFSFVEEEKLQAGPFEKFRSVLKELGVSYDCLVLQPTRLAEGGMRGFYSLILPTFLTPVGIEPSRRKPSEKMEKIATILKHLGEASETGEPTLLDIFRLSLSSTAFYTPTIINLDDLIRGTPQGLKMDDFLSRPPQQARNETTSKVFASHPWLQAMVRVSRQND